MKRTDKTSRSISPLLPVGALLLLSLIFLTGCTDPEGVGPPNRPPVVESLSANPVVLSAGQISAISAVASDPDGDKLAFEWVADLGYLTGQGGEVYYAAPICCANWAVIRVTVKDGNGGVAHDTVTLKIENTP